MDRGARRLALGGSHLDRFAVRSCQHGDRGLVTEAAQLCAARRLPLVAWRRSPRALPRSTPPDFLAMRRRRRPRLRDRGSSASSRRRTLRNVAVPVAQPPIVEKQHEDADGAEPEGPQALRGLPRSRSISSRSPQHVGRDGLADSRRPGRRREHGATVPPAVATLIVPMGWFRIAARVLGRFMPSGR